MSKILNYDQWKLNEEETPVRLASGKVTGASQTAVKGLKKSLSGGLAGGALSIPSDYYKTVEGQAKKGAVWANKLVKELGMTKESAAAVAGNIMKESRFMPNALQGKGYKTGTLKDSGSLGYSWAQWTTSDRKKKFQEHVKKKFGVDINTTPAKDEHAYSFLKAEMQDRYMGDKVWYHSLIFDSFKKSKDITSATKEFMREYEMNKRKDDPAALKERADLAKMVYKLMA